MLDSTFSNNSTLQQTQSKRAGTSTCVEARGCVDILLPTYNGAAHLRSQLDSLCKQTLLAQHIFIRDDGSTDETWGILAEYMLHVPTICADRGPRLGIVGNVDVLLQRSTSSYFLLCDQDDVWYPQKTSTLLQKMVELEHVFGAATPLLVYSDARLIDAEGQPIAFSFFQYQNQDDANADTLKRWLVCSRAAGCAMLGNAALRTLAVPLPPAENIFMHDWWLLLLAGTCGGVGVVLEPLLDYRQHGGNALGVAKPLMSMSERWQASRENAARTQRQTRELLKRYGSRMPIEIKTTCEAWANMPLSPHILRLWICWLQGFGKRGLNFLRT